MLCRKDVLRNFPKFTRKKPALESLFNKVANLRLADLTLLKMRLRHRRFRDNFAKFLITLFCRIRPVAASENRVFIYFPYTIWCLYHLCLKLCCTFIKYIDSTRTLFLGFQTTKVVSMELFSVGRMISNVCCQLAFCEGAYL